MGFPQKLFRVGFRQLGKGHIRTCHPADTLHNMPYRVQTVAVRLMQQYAVYCRGLAQVMAAKCTGRDQAARDAAKVFWNEFGKQELALERYYDHALAVNAYQEIMNTESEYEM